MDAREEEDDDEKKKEKKKQKEEKDKDPYFAIDREIRRDPVSKQ